MAVYLVDTNSYVRAARSVPCVLGDHAGLMLRLLSEIAHECSRSPRIKELSPWMLHPPHPETRLVWTLPLDKPAQKLVSKARVELKFPLEDALDDFAKKRKARGDYRAVLSGPDKALFYTAYALGYGVVTDEGALAYACDEFEVPHLTTLGLLSHLHDGSLISRQQVEAVVKLWQYEKDTPKDWQNQFRQYFGEPIPIFQLNGG